MVIPIRLKTSNAYLIKGSKPVLVDTGSPHETPAIMKALEEHRIRPADLSLILHTHGHSDHCGNTCELKQLSRAPTAIHQADAHMLSRGINDPLIATSSMAKLIRPFVNRPFAGVEADIVIEREMDLDAYGIQGRIVFTPGHTSGSISIIVEDEAIVGDLMMGGYVGGMFCPGHPSYHYFADDIAGVRSSIRKILDYSPTRIYVGHGGPLKTRDVVQRFSGETES
ncbi:MAG TPA: MBL fold metallo-hydrolase [Abditibacteriaceae bacterium]|jgi:glyoxylase-like metal-dependent hydrolase (beta-lactamase superfamily II)